MMCNWMKKNSGKINLALIVLSVVFVFNAWIWMFIKKIHFWLSWIIFWYPKNVGFCWIKWRHVKAVAVDVFLMEKFLINCADCINSRFHYIIVKQTPSAIDFCLYNCIKPCPKKHKKLKEALNFTFNDLPSIFK